MSDQPKLLSGPTPIDEALAEYERLGQDIEDLKAARSDIARRVRNEFGDGFVVGKTEYRAWCNNTPDGRGTYSLVEDGPHDPLPDVSGRLIDMGDGT